MQIEEGNRSILAIYKNRLLCDIVRLPQLTSQTSQTAAYTFFADTTDLTQLRSRTVATKTAERAQAKPAEYKRNHSVADGADALRCVQVAALPIRQDTDGAIHVLLITSRQSGRWIIPKGWPMKGLKDNEAAAQEAFEEAGIIGHVHKRPLGSYIYWKRQSGYFQLCEVTVFFLAVDRQHESWREKGQRRMVWLSAADAAERVEEPGLCALIASLGTDERAEGQSRPRVSITGYQESKWIKSDQA
jgi:8-oxo-dGTP pyrophosphatase MutT (NUDIX family)